MGNPVIIYTDGACRGNPGPGGWGAVLIHGNHRKELYGGESSTTNNRMELTAAIESLKALTRPSRVSVYTDSTYVKNGMQGWLRNWKKNNWLTAQRKPVKNQDLWKVLDELVGRHDVDWHWVKGHSGNPGNERADLLANRGIDGL
ncbi:MAG: ribonuclease HI [Gammaproteobacteria bacterium]|nr:ribonuclease HI [Gammaproteobacteria bacterium]